MKLRTVSVAPGEMDVILPVTSVTPSPATPVEASWFGKLSGGYRTLIILGVAAGAWYLLKRKN